MPETWHLKTIALITSGVEALLTVLNRFAISVELMRKDIRVSTATSNGAITTPCSACIYQAILLSIDP